MRNSQAKYGAKIPAPRNTGAKQVQPSTQSAPAEPAAKPARKTAKSADKKR